MLTASCVNDSTEAVDGGMNAEMEQLKAVPMYPRSPGQEPRVGSVSLGETPTGDDSNAYAAGKVGLEEATFITALPNEMHTEPNQLSASEPAELALAAPSPWNTPAQMADVTECITPSDEDAGATEAKAREISRPQWHRKPSGKPRGRPPKKKQEMRATGCAVTTVEVALQCAQDKAPGAAHVGNISSAVTGSAVGLEKVEGAAACTPVAGKSQLLESFSSTVSVQQVADTVRWQVLSKFSIKVVICCGRLL